MPAQPPPHRPCPRCGHRTWHLDCPPPVPGQPEQETCGGSPGKPAWFDIDGRPVKRSRMNPMTRCDGCEDCRPEQETWRCRDCHLVIDDAGPPLTCRCGGKVFLRVYESEQETCDGSGRIEVRDDSYCNCIMADHCHGEQGKDGKPCRLAVAGTGTEGSPGVAAAPRRSKPCPGCKACRRECAYCGEPITDDEESQRVELATGGAVMHSTCLDNNAVDRRVELRRPDSGEGEPKPLYRWRLNAQSPWRLTDWEAVPDDLETVSDLERVDYVLADQRRPIQPDPNQSKDLDDQPESEEGERRYVDETDDEGRVVRLRMPICPSCVHPEVLNGATECPDCGDPITWVDFVPADQPESGEGEWWRQAFCECGKPVGEPAGNCLHLRGVAGHEKAHDRWLVPADRLRAVEDQRNAAWLDAEKLHDQLEAAEHRAAEAVRERDEARAQHLECERALARDHAEPGRVLEQMERAEAAEARARTESERAEKAEAENRYLHEANDEFRRLLSDRIIEDVEKLGAYVNDGLRVRAEQAEADLKEHAAVLDELRQERDRERERAAEAVGALREVLDAIREHWTVHARKYASIPNENIPLYDVSVRHRTTLAHLDPSEGENDE